MHISLHEGGLLMIVKMGCLGGAHSDTVPTRWRFYFDWSGTTTVPLGTLISVDDNEQNSFRKRYRLNGL